MIVHATTNLDESIYRKISERLAFLGACYGLYMVPETIEHNNQTKYLPTVSANTMTLTITMGRCSPPPPATELRRLALRGAVDSKDELIAVTASYKLLFRRDGKLYLLPRPKKPGVTKIHLPLNEELFWETLPNLHQILQAEVTQIVTVYGLTLKQVLPGEIGQVTTIELVLVKSNLNAYMWHENAIKLGLNQNWLNSSFIYDGDFYQIIGLKKRSIYRPVLVKRIRDGLKFSFKSERVIELMKMW